MADAQEVLDVLEAIHQEEQRPIATSTEIAERVDVDRRRVLQLLDALEAVDAVGSARVARGRAFWSTDVVQVVSPERPPEVPPADPPAETPAEESATDGSLTGIRETVQELESLPGSGDLREQRVDAVLAVLEELDDAGELKASEFRERVYPEYPAEYASARSWWKNAISPALSELRDQDVVTLANRHDGIWRLSG